MFSLLIIAILASTDVSFGYYKPRVKHVCENDLLDICCNDGERIRIENAFYGYNSESVPRNCQVRGRKTEECSVPATTHFVSANCSDQKCCTLRASPQIFDNMSFCSKGTLKYLSVTYTCVTIKTCRSKYEHFSTVASVCPETCDPIYYYYGPCGTEPGCVCNEGLIRDHLTNNCVAKPLCPYYNYLDPGETTPESFDACIFGCGELCPTCVGMDPCATIRQICRPGYKCEEGYCRDDKTRKCVKRMTCS